MAALTELLFSAQTSRYHNEPAVSVGAIAQPKNIRNRDVYVTTTVKNLAKKGLALAKSHCLSLAPQKSYKKC